MTQSRTDPAFLLYPRDFLAAAAQLTQRETGQFITLLCLLHLQGHMTLRAMRKVVGAMSEDLLANFAVDSEGLYYNPMLDDLIEKRQKYCEKQRERARLRWDKIKAENDGPAANPALPSSADFPQSLAEKPSSSSVCEPSPPASRGIARSGMRAAMPINENEDGDEIENENEIELVNENEIRTSEHKTRTKEREHENAAPTRTNGAPERAAPDEPPRAPGLKPLPLPPSFANSPHRRSPEKTAPPYSGLSPAQQKAFDRFWEAYPRKMGRRKAEELFAFLPERLWDRLLAAVERQKRSEQWTRDNGRYIPYPATWLSEGRWDDLPDAAAPAKPYDWAALADAVNRV